MVHPTAAVTPVSLPSSTRARRDSGECCDVVEECTIVGQGCAR
ncbi:hypothetical protein F383_36324 [Gossypium arboreum]|uniref:Uncharacterized protein n=1 Tax=Gossypium arboreum TaxID=29729 RepID=A0A0B0PVI1_GOSAR|nr:hypothetical protein F383_36324 [Gossypium arboreum]